MLGLDGKLLLSLHKVSFSQSQAFQFNNGVNKSFVAIISGGLKIFFLIIDEKFFLLGLLIDGEEVTETPRFQRAEFVIRPNIDALINLIKRIH